MCVQDVVISGDDYLPGAHVHILLVLCNHCHGDCWHDIQVHRVPRVGFHGDVLILFELATRSNECVMGLLKATVYVAHMFLHVCVCVCQSGERVGRRYPWSLPQCCSLRPPQVGRGTSTHQKLEVRSPQDACSFTKYSRYIEF